MSALRIADALRQAAVMGLDRVDAHALMAFLMGQDRAWLIAHDDQPLTPPQAQTWAALCQRRAAGEPVAYLVGQQAFHGLVLTVTPAVLIPRPDTEVLVDWALDCLAALPGRPRVLDLGCGSGAIALAIQAACPRAVVTAVDLSPAALAVAQANAHRLGLPVRCLQGSWLSPVLGEQFELIVSNPPYIAQGDPHLPALRHEPLSALTSGAQGLDDLRQLCAEAPKHLVDGGWLLLEHGWDQAPATAELLRGQGGQAIAHRRDLGGHLRCSGAQFRAGARP